MKQIAILGAGRVGSALAAGLVQAGYRVTVGIRSVENPLPGWTGPEVTFADHASAVRQNPIVINATPGDTSLERLSLLKSELRGKVLIDVSNATRRDATGASMSLLYPDESLGELLQAALPETSVVKTLNTMMFTVMVDPKCLATRPTAFLSGNDEEAKSTVASVLEDLGWPSEWIEDLGDMTSARGAEAMFSVVPFVLRQFGFRPFALTISR
ncbi:NADPH-dependent F420 reductase [Paraburkholderia sp. J12]|uniref:NADPH-dependent F420 reductase n=1 Tax=Paraburkholderia sp. J12 TaxID=2805432 RepID=UPI002ABDE165|nr:NAD(P)-binding domain-containing protein [Paraburkholderia sp. J12]